MAETKVILTIDVSLKYTFSPLSLQHIIGSQPGRTDGLGGPIYSFL